MFRRVIQVLFGAAAVAVGAAAPAGEVAGGNGLHFRTDILPLLTKAGCNAGACHGAAIGQGGFRLSLLGYDPEQDHAALTRELGGRRVDTAAPERSLFLRKGTDDLDHDGGRRIKPASDAYEALARWVAAGAPLGDAELRVTQVEVAPSNSLLPAVGGRLQLQVTASRSDGRQENATARALYSSNDDAIATVDGQGLVTLHARGVTSIMVRYSGLAVAARVGVPFSDGEAPPAARSARNLIDALAFAEWSRLKVSAAPTSGDAEFFRRVHLDLIGRLPEPDDVSRFLAEPPSDAKRDRTIAALLGRGDFTDFWTLKLSDWLLMRGARGKDKGTRAYHDWLHKQLAENRPLDALAKELVQAAGPYESSGPANFYLLANDPRDMGEHVSRMFLGTQIACARCHAHPADRWTQEDYHAFAAYFARVARDGGQVRLSARGEIAHPKTGRLVSARPLGGDAPAIEAEDPREALADWITSAENPFFARNWVNRVWREMFGAGLVEPVDDLRPTNPASIPDLLDGLAEAFARQRFDLRWLAGEIARSRVYQLSSQAGATGAGADRLFAQMALKPLPAQVFADAVADVSGVPDEFEGHPPGTRAVQLIGATVQSYALDVLGRCGRERSCETPGRSGGGLSQALHLINGASINDKLRRGRLPQLLAQGSPDAALVEELYLRALSRPPIPAESEAWLQAFAEAGDRAALAEDLLWALLNSREFAFNH